MSTVSGAMVGVQQAQTQAAMAAEMMKINAEMAAGLAQMIEETSEAGEAAAAAPPAGMGQVVDVSV